MSPRPKSHGVVSFYHDFRRDAGRTARCSSCAAPKPARRSAARIWSPISAAHGLEVDRRRRRRAARRRDRLLPGQLRASPAALLDGEPIGRLDARRSIDRRATGGGRGDERARLHPARFRRAVRRRRQGGAAPSPRSRGARARGRRSCAPARAACSGWSRWSRWRRATAASPMVRSCPATSRSLFDAGFLAGGAHPKALGLGRRDPLSARASSG